MPIRLRSRWTMAGAALSIIAPVALLIAPPSDAGAALLKTSTSVSASTATIPANEYITVSATVSTLGLGGLIVTPTGQVDFSASNGATTVNFPPSTVEKPCLLTLISCTTTDSVAFPAPGVWTLSATYVGDTLSKSSSSSIQESVLKGTPSAPTDAVVYPGSAQNIVAWQASSSNGGAPITGYDIYESTTGQNFTIIASDVAASPYTDNNAENGTNYYYTVTAVNGLGQSSSSNVAAGEPATAGPNTVACTGQANCGSGVQEGYETPDASEMSAQVDDNGTGTGTLVEGLDAGVLGYCSNYYFGAEATVTDSTGDQKSLTVEVVGPDADTLESDYESEPYDFVCYGSTQDFLYNNEDNVLAAAPFNSTDGLYEAPLDYCYNAYNDAPPPCFEFQTPPPGYGPATYNSGSSDGYGVSTFTFTVLMPGGAGDPRLHL